MQKFIRWCWFLFSVIMSLMLVAYAYDVRNGTTVEGPSTPGASVLHELTLPVARFLGVTGSIILAVLAVAFFFYRAIRLYFKA